MRAMEWSGPPIPSDLLDRRVELTGPVSRKLLINALNSDANVVMGDFEDSTSPTWYNVIDGQINCRDAVRRTIELTAPGGKQYRLKGKTATLMVRPRGWHLIEAHIVVDGSASFHTVNTACWRSCRPHYAAVFRGWVMLRICTVCVCCQ